MLGDNEELKELLRLNLAGRIAGDFSAHQSDPFFTVKSQYPEPYIFSEAGEKLPLYPRQIPELLLTWANLDIGKARSKEDILVLDLETSGLGRSGTFAIMIGLGYYEGDTFTIEQIFLPEPDAEEHSLERLKELLDSHSLIISFNGKSFDISILKSRYLYHQVWQDFASIEHLDLLHIARRLWKHKLPSCALESIEYYILGQYREQAWEIEGRDIPHSYIHYLLSGETYAIERIFSHNRLDILHTMALFGLISEICTYPPEDYDPRIDYLALARLYLSQKRTEDAKSILTGYLDKGLIDRQMLYELGMIHKRAGEQAAAKTYFAEASNWEHEGAMLEYAKLLEKEKDYPQALNICQKLLEAESRAWPPQERWKEDLQRRAQRLQQRLNK